MKTIQYHLKTKVCSLYLVASETALQGVHWKKQPGPLVKTLDRKNPAQAILARAAAQLTEYMEGKRQAFDLPLESEGTVFQKQVWSQLRKIPYGKTFSYRDIARKIRNEKAIRAVGTANGRNPFCIIVPCHRVIAANGSLGGYAGGLEIKTKLLDLERKR